ncbi:MAG TPA: hypothetical protein VM597_12500 [Gemmataceae bacterium]|nr:hypothetical protein [Gemmataceae bacterium]
MPLSASHSFTTSSPARVRTRHAIRRPLGLYAGVAFVATVPPRSARSRVNFISPVAASRTVSAASPDVFATNSRLPSGLQASDWVEANPSVLGGRPALASLFR